MTDVIVIGGGIIGSTVALALADRGSTVTLVGRPRSGAASVAAAGMLAPSIEPDRGQAYAFAAAARDVFPAYIDYLADRSGRRVALDRRGILEVALDAAETEQLRRRVDSTATWLTSDQVAGLEPSLARTHGGVLWTNDGAVDNVALVAALDACVRLSPRIVQRHELASEIEASSTAARVRVSSGEWITAGTIVLAAGAWAGLIPGAPWARAVEPVRGQLVAFEGAQLDHVVYAARVYLVPREKRCTIAGSTMERVGFDVRTTPSACSEIERSARALSPRLPPPSTAWAGLRPVTPDLLPLIGRDPERPRLVYACGHSRNGILLAPQTAEVVAGIIFEERLNFDIRQFDPARFEGTLTIA